MPHEFIARYPEGPLRTTVNGMSAFLDDCMYNLTSALRAKGMWQHTLLVFSGDNGGYLGNGGDDTPLRGGKFSDFEGGVRTPSFVAGGLLPAHRRGQVLTGSRSYIHIADWSTTFLTLAGVADPAYDARAHAAGLPPMDGLDVWPLVSGANLTSPRDVVPLSVLPSTLSAASGEGYWAADVGYYVGGEGLISGRYKLLRGFQHRGCFSKTSNVSCTAMVPPTTDGWTAGDEGVQCTCGVSGCLFDIEADPTEQTDVAAAHPHVVSKLHAQLEAVRATLYAPDRGPVEQAACDAIEKYGGFWGPWL